MGLVIMKVQMECYYQDNCIYVSVGIFVMFCVMMDVLLCIFGNFVIFCSDDFVLFGIVFKLVVMGNGLVVNFVYIIDQKDNKEIKLLLIDWGLICIFKWIMKKGDLC